jgi:N-dimethylarginine dimethylaminohydrolase
VTAKSLPIGRQLFFASIAAGLALVVGASHARGQSAVEIATECAGVIPDSSGTISEVLLQYDPDLVSELGPFYRDFLGSLPSDVRVIVICPSEWAAREFMDTWEPELRRRVAHIINVGLPISIWARDRYVSRQPGDLTNRVEGFVPVGDATYEQEKHNDLLALELLGQSRIMPSVLDSPLHVEGGNVVSNERHVFVGANMLGDNDDIAQHELTNELERLAGREYVLVSDEDGHVPWCHIDMYLTPVTDDTVLVASPRMAAMIRSRFGDDDDESADGLGPGFCVGDSLQQRFDDVADLMRDRGYRVLRLPALVESPGEAMVTYNNVIMDHRGKQRIVYMPVYDVPELDRTAAAIYRGLGFEVRAVDVSELYLRGGAVRCLVNVTERRDIGSANGSRARHRGIRFKDLAVSHQYEQLLHRADERLARRGSRHNRRWSALP